MVSTIADQSAIHLREAHHRRGRLRGSAATLFFRTLRLLSSAKENER
jgi:hypothetical protein